MNWDNKRELNSAIYCKTGRKSDPAALEEEHLYILQQLGSDPHILQWIDKTGCRLALLCFKDFCDLEYLFKVTRRETDRTRFVTANR